LSQLLEEHLPLLLRTASLVSEDWSRFTALPEVVA
jgi:hypothetical protein